MIERGTVRPERIAPAGDHVPAEAVRNGDRVEAVGGDGREVEARAGPRRPPRRAGGTEHECARAAGRAAAQEAAPRDRPFGKGLEIGGRGVPAVTPAGIVP